MRGRHLLCACARARAQWENASMMVVVYDVSNAESFKSCAKWIKRVRDANPDHRVAGVLVANKARKRRRRRQRQQQWALLARARACAGCGVGVGIDRLTRGGPGGR